MLNVVFDKISQFFKRTFACFGLITVCMALYGYVSNQDEYAKYISVDMLLAFFVFSLLFALSFGIADFIKNNSILRRFAQFVLTYLSVAAVFFFGGVLRNYTEANNVQNTAFTILAISFVYVIIYVVCGAVVLVFNAIKSKLLSKNDDYENMFENK